MIAAFLAAQIAKKKRSRLLERKEEAAKQENGEHEVKHKKSSTNRNLLKLQILFI
jgi:hypothetical protein